MIKVPIYLCTIFDHAGEIYRSHDDEYENYCLLGYCVV
jgi:hypothetical protein